MLPNGRRAAWVRDKTGLCWQRLARSGKRHTARCEYPGVSASADTKPAVRSEFTSASAESSIPKLGPVALTTRSTKSCLSSPLPRGRHDTCKRPSAAITFWMRPAYTCNLPLRRSCSMRVGQLRRQSMPVYVPVRLQVPHEAAPLGGGQLPPQARRHISESRRRPRANRPRRLCTSRAIARPALSSCLSECALASSASPPRSSRRPEKRLAARQQSAPRNRMQHRYTSGVAGSKPTPHPPWSIRCRR